MPELPIADIIIPDRRFSRLRKIPDLAASIAEFGLMHPVVIRPDKTLVAGARRLAACRSLGWSAVPVTIVDGLTEALQALKAETDENVCREDLTPAEAVEQARLLDELEREKARERQGTRTDLELSGNLPEGSAGDSRDAIGAAVGMSGKTYEKAKAIVEAAEKAPEEFGDLAKELEKPRSVDKTYKKLRERKQKAKITKLAKEVEAMSKDERWHIELGDVRTYQTDQRFDFIITDPPYPREFLPLYGILAERAKEWLKPGGSLLTMAGQSYLPEIYALLSEHLTYQWTISYLTPGGQAAQLWNRKVNTFWKPVLWYVNGKYEGEWHGDVCRSATNDNDKRFHDWGQSESGMADLIERFTNPGDLIMDPFCGGGTTGVVAVQLNRLFLGIDIDQSHVDTAIVRMANV